MAGAAGRCRTTRSRGCRVHRAAVPARNYLMSAGVGVVVCVEEMLLGGVETGWGVMTEGRRWTTRPGRCRVYRVSAPARNYLREVG
jgi:hypothetical protein